MRMLYLLLIVCTCIYKPGVSNPVPEKLRALIITYTKDSTTAFGFEGFKSNNEVEKPLIFNDIRVGSPVEVYYIVNDKLEKLPDSMPVEAFIVPTGRWKAPIYYKGRCAYFISTCQKEQSWIFCGAECCAIAKEWDKMRKAWPENSGIIPVLIEFGVYTALYFPQKGKHNLTFMFGDNDAVRASTNYAILDDSKKGLSQLKKYWETSKKGLRENPPPKENSIDVKGGNHE
jgi:hypothetical protein